jgi:hypothetical protein
MAAPIRQGRKALPIIVAAILGLLLMPAIGAAQDEQWQFGSAPSFSSGKYGTDTRTDVLYTPMTARRLFTDGDLTFVFPFICIWGDGSVTVVNESAVRQQRVSTSGATTTDRSGRSVGTSGTTASSASGRNCGMGDIIVRGRYFLVDENAWMPTIAVRAHVKAPTASAARYLGTGRPDEGVGIEVSRTIAGGPMAMVDGGYTFIGKPAGVNYSNTWWYGVGIGQDLIKNVVNLSLFFEEDRAIVPGFANSRDVLAAVSVKSASGWRLQLSGEIGLSDGAPDHGVTFGASRRF